MDITKESLKSDLRKIGLEQGDHVSIASALSTVGHISGGPEAFIDAVMDVIGPEGTLMVNTYTPFFYNYQIKALDSCPPFNPQSTHCLTGIIAETMRKRPQAIRSCHPTSSVAAIGAKAGFLTDGHGPHAAARLPYSRLAELGGKSLFIGLGDNLVALRHEAQYRAGLLDAVHLESCIYYIDEDGETRLFKGADVTSCVRTLPRLVRIMRERGLLKEGTVGNAPCILVSTNDALHFMTELLNKEPTLNLCDSMACIWCRELERKMNLYSQIKNPRSFQKNIVWIRLLSLINKHRLRGSRTVLGSMFIISAAYNRTCRRLKVR